MISCYSSWKSAKTGESIPCYNDGKPFASLYNPKREAEQFADMVNSGFTLVAGFGAGLHINEIHKKYPHNKVIVVEKNEASITFLSESKIIIPEGIILCTVQELQASLLENYFPPIDGNFSLLPVRSWIDANSETFETIKQVVKKALDKISSDISVQSHFGKLWHRNIFENLKMCEQSNLLDFYNTDFPVSKKAFIAGAGPGLESSINKLKKNRDDYYILATDTAYSVLSAAGIISDVVLSVDPQLISYSHFMCEKSSKTIFAFDLCASPIAVRNLKKDNHTLCFFKSEHPLCVYIDNWYSKEKGKSFFPTINSSGGTVSLAALNFAKEAGFASIESGGCDFAYLQGKMYAKGIYMDAIFNSISNRFNSALNYFSSIMFRSELVKVKNGKTTKILQTYKNAFDSFFAMFTQSNTSVHTTAERYTHYKEGFLAKDFILQYKEQLIACNTSDDLAKTSSLYVTLLPYIAWYTHKNSCVIKKEKIYEIALNTTIHF